MKSSCLLILFYVCTTMLCSAQTCTGSLGDAVMNVDFGAGNSISSSLPTGTTNYTYQPTGCVLDGSYRIVNSIIGCYTATWHQLTEDHTSGDTQGYMMLVNASNAPGVFYKQSVSGLCSNTIYEFSAWIVNINKSDPILPNISFSIETSDGQQLSQPYSTGNIANTSSAIWLKYGFLFKSPAAVNDIVLVIKNNAPGGYGNDLALDDITFKPCGPVITPLAAPQGNQVLCEGKNSTIMLTAAASNGFQNPAFQWQVKHRTTKGWQDITSASSLNEQYTVSAADVYGYKFRLAAAETGNMLSLSCRVFSDSISLSVNPAIAASAGKDKTTFQHQAVRLDGSTSAINYNFFWSPTDYLNDPRSISPLASPPEDITYTLSVFSSDGCSSTAVDKVFIKVNKEIFVPNTFSPNNDGINDRWEIAGLSTYSGFVIKVYNRFGELVYKSNGSSAVWDGTINGKNAATGTYSYIIETDGKKLSGWLLLLK